MPNTSSSTSNADKFDVGSEFTNKGTAMKTILSVCLSLWIFPLLLTSCHAEPTPTESPSEELPCSAMLEETEDFGQAYLDSIIFFGESTTYHMKHREVLRYGKDTDQVWAPDNGTVNLDYTVPNLRIRYPDTGEALTVGEAAARKQPEYMILTFGLNGAVQNVKRGEDFYKSCYRTLVRTVQDASPNTKIILQSAPPVAKNMDMSRYTVSVEELNRCIRQINQWTLSLAEEEHVRYLNTAEILTEEDGFLKDAYQVGDGHHLTKEAYVAMLSYIRTHGYE